MSNCEHKPVGSFDDAPLIRVRNMYKVGDIEVYLCKICHLLYWEVRDKDGGQQEEGR